MHLIRLARCTSRIVCVALAVLILAAGAGRASEYGISTYRSGLFDLLAGYLPAPGTGAAKQYYFVSTANGSFTTRNGQVTDDVGLTAYGTAFELAYVTQLRIFDSYWAFGTLVPFAFLTESGDLSINGTPIKIHQSSKVGGLGDVIFFPCALHWDLEQFHLVAAFATYLPTGSYDRHRVLNVGLNRWAFEPDFGLTWLDRRTRIEFSLFTGYTINMKNSETHYQSGQEFHVDFALAKHLPSGFDLGMAGYALQQTTRDEGRGAILGPFKGRVIGLGPIVAYTFKIRGKPVGVSVKYIFEFLSQNRLSGDPLWINFGMEF